MSGEKPCDNLKFNEEVDKIRTFCQALTPEEYAAIFNNNDKFDVEVYRNQFYPGFPIGNAIKHAQDTLESFQEELEAFRLKKDLEVNNLTLPKLLVRFIKLPEIFRTYLKTVVITEIIRERYKGATLDSESESEVISDDLFVQELTNMELSSQEKFKRLKRFVFALRIFDKKLKEFESVA